MSSSVNSITDTPTPPTLQINITQTTSGSIKTSEGTLYVSKPYRSKTSKKLRTLITFIPRQSHFDINNESSVANEFRGFFSLFWISIFIFTVQVYVRGIESNGRPLDLAFATLLLEDAIALALSDAALVLSTGICVPIAIAMKKGWIKYYWIGLVIQHILQTSILFAAVMWTFNRKWPWVQSGFLTLHSLVMIMKMHSYLNVNGHLQQVTLQSNALMKELHLVVQLVGGWDKALMDAKAHRAEIDALQAMATSDPNTPTPTRTPDATEGSTTSYTDAATANAPRRRLTAVSLVTEGNISVVNVSSSEPSAGHGNSSIRHYLHEPHPLVDHHDQRIAQIARDYSDLRSELTSSGPTYVTWPNNITVKDFALFQLFPTLVYMLEYPRTDRIRPMYVFEKTVATFGTFTLLYTVTERFILPIIPTSDQSIFRSSLDLALPFMIAYLLLFYIVFECICNTFAELSQYGTRCLQSFPLLIMPSHVALQTVSFTRIGWNSTSWDEYSRKWNKPVHTFLLRHVYAPPVLGYGISRTWAMSLTFLLSACVHELVMVIVTKKFRMYLFVLQIVQIPMIQVSRIPMVKRNKLLGNLVFWIGLYTGLPLLCVAYVAH